MPNHVIIYSNGIADFRWQHELTANETKTITIPVRAEYLSDILCSLTVYGEVQWSSPPVYRPTDNQRRILDLDNQNVMTSIATQLSGAQVSIALASETITGKLLGFQSEEKPADRRPLNIQVWLVVTDSGLRRVPIPEIQSFQFLDPAIQAEIELAMVNNIDQMKPNSTSISLGLTAENATQATVQYTVPSAAWKTSYRIFTDTQAKKIRFLGFAIVDNNTDDDWNNFLISVVNGEPITFSSDLDEVKTPGRQHVNLVRDRAIGSVEVESFSDQMAFAASPRAVPAPAARTDKMKQSRKPPGAAKRHDQDQIRSQPATFHESTSQQSGDFCIFHSPLPVSIGANSSAMIPTFDIALDNSQAVLFYDESQNQQRPYRAIQFCNSTDFPLGRGACTVYDDHNYAGSCVMPNTKTGAEAMLIHALDTGVKVEKNERDQQKRFAVTIEAGVAIELIRETRTTTYTIHNRHDQAFKLLFEHKLTRPKLESLEIALVCGDDESLEPLEHLIHDRNHCRIEIALPASATVRLKVDEEFLNRNRIHLLGESSKNSSFDLKWLQRNMISLGESYRDSPQLKACLVAKSDLVKKQESLVKLNKQQKRLIARQERLRKNIKVGAEDLQSQTWRKELADTENRLVEIEDSTLPEIQSEIDQLQQKCFDAIKSLTLDWRQ